MSASVPADETQASIERREGPLNEVGGPPDLEAEATEPEADVVEPDVSAGEDAPPSPPETEGDSASEPDNEGEADPELLADMAVTESLGDPEPLPETESFTREIPGAAGHGPARAYGYISIATALGAVAELTSGGTRSTSANPLIVTVQTNAATFSQINDVYDELLPVAEQTAAAKRNEIRKENPAVPSYDLGLATRAVLAGFPQGAASALREPGTTKPAPLAQATRARRVDEGAHRSAVASGRNWARHHLTAARDRQSA